MGRLTLFTAIPAFANDLGDVIRLFFGEVTMDEAPGGEAVRHYLTCYEHVAQFRGYVCRVPRPTPLGDPLSDKRLNKRAAKLAVYGALKAATGVKPPWGSLTGIRPTRLFYEQLMEGKGAEEAVSTLVRRFDVDREKAQLLRRIVQVQSGVPVPAPGDVDVYISIPFCRTRCSYCSFAAVDVKSGGQWMDAYVDALLKELRACREELSAYRVRALYVGGGTPTALSCGQLARVLDEALTCYPGAREFTVEAGRPDTIDEEKLRLLLDRGVTRVSVNPQTMNEETLLRVGRDHTASDVVRVYERMREMGFAVVNMDLILALPGEGEREVARTLEAVARLGPDNLTVHALAIKRASRLHETGQQADPAQAARMVEQAATAARRMGMAPYYLYRQKYMAGNLENVGYCKPGTASIYNIDIMEEIAPVAAFGAGAISKWLYPAARRIERAPNVKNIPDYIARVEEMARRKRTLWARG